MWYDKYTTQDYYKKSNNLFFIDTPFLHSCIIPHTIRINTSHITAGPAMLHNYTTASQWRHNDHDGVPNHQLHDCLSNHLVRRRSRKTSKLRVTGLCTGNSPVIGEFPAQMASNAEEVSIWWRHHTCGASISVQQVKCLICSTEIHHKISTSIRETPLLTLSNTLLKHAAWVWKKAFLFNNYFSVHLMTSQEQENLLIPTEQLLEFCFDSESKNKTPCYHPVRRTACGLFY